LGKGPQPTAEVSEWVLSQLVYTSSMKKFREASSAVTEASAIHPRFSLWGQSVGMDARLDLCERRMMACMALRVAPVGVEALKDTLPLPFTPVEV
jgi:hypothetical protein